LQNKCNNQDSKHTLEQEHPCCLLLPHHLYHLWWVRRGS